MFCFCFLAYGEEHINEFNIVAKSLLKLNQDFKIVVGTDSPSQILNEAYKVVEIREPFNYNLKREVIKQALEEFNTLLFLDTDVFIRNGIDFSVLSNVENGLHAAEIVELDKLKDVYGSLDYMKDYLQELNSIFEKELFLIHEGYFVLKIENNEQKKSFIEYWEEIDKRTRPYQKLAYNLPGAMEGIIMWIAVQKSKINLKLADKEVAKLFEFISHFGKRNRKLERTIL